MNKGKRSHFDAAKVDESRSSSSLQTGGRPTLYSLSYQNHKAAVEIQRLLRGRLCRLHLWNPNGGIAYVNRVTKLQKCWRGRLGRIKAAQIFFRKRQASGLKIKGLFYIWKYKRFRFRKMLLFVNTCVSTVQRYYRMRKAFRIVDGMRRKRLERLTRKVQLYLLIYLACRKCAIVKQKLASLRNHLIKFIVKTNAGGIPNSISRLDIILNYSFGIGLYERALQISITYNQSYDPVLALQVPGAEAEKRRYASQLALGSYWTRNVEGGAICIDYLEEAQLMMMQYELLVKSSPSGDLLATSLLIDSSLNANVRTNSVAFEFTDELYLQAARAARGVSLYEQLLRMADRLLFFALVHQFHHAACQQSFASLRPLQPHSLSASLASATGARKACIVPSPLSSRALPDFERQEWHSSEAPYNRGASLSLLQTSERLFRRSFRLLNRAHLLLTEESLHKQEIVMKLSWCQRFLKTTSTILLLKNAYSIFDFGGCTPDSHGSESYEPKEEKRCKLMVDTEVTYSRGAVGRDVMVIKGCTTLGKLLLLDFATHPFLKKFDRQFQEHYDICYPTLIAPSSPNESSTALIKKKKALPPPLVASSQSPPPVPDSPRLAAWKDEVTAILNTPLALKPIILFDREIKCLLELHKATQEVPATEEASVSTSTAENTKTARSGTSEKNRSGKGKVEEVVNEALKAPLPPLSATEEHLLELSRLCAALVDKLRLVTCSSRFMEPLLKDHLQSTREYLEKMVSLHKKVSVREAEEYDGSDDEAEEIEDEKTNNWREAIMAVLQVLHRFPSISFKLPMIEYSRRLENGKAFIEHSTRVLQRVFRGYRGRCRHRRVRLKANERLRQALRLADHRDSFVAPRRVRYLWAAVIQKRIRGVLWRMHLKRLNELALRIQNRARIVRAKKRFLAELNRKLHGPPITQMITHRAKLIGDRRLSLKVYRCGDWNYKFVGLDLVRNLQHSGAIYAEGLRALIEQHNASYPSASTADRASRIGIWQHERVCELLLDNLSLVSSLNAPTAHLGGNKLDTHLMLVVRAHLNHSAPGLLQANTNLTSSHFKTPDFTHMKTQLGGGRKNKMLLLTNYNKSKQVKGRKL